MKQRLEHIKLTTAPLFIVFWRTYSLRRTEVAELFRMDQIRGKQKQLPEYNRSDSELGSFIQSASGANYVVT